MVMRNESLPARYEKYRDRALPGYRANQGRVGDRLRMKGREEGLVEFERMERDNVGMFGHAALTTVAASRFE